MAWPVPCRFSLYRLKQEDRDMSCRILANVMLICLVACSDTSTPVTEEIPTSGEIEVAMMRQTTATPMRIASLFIAVGAVLSLMWRRFPTFRI
jgi:hypothetical protein